MAEQPESDVGSLPRLLLKIEKLQLVFRFTFAFHAREVRFEIETRDGFRRVFPETFSFARAQTYKMKTLHTEQRNAILCAYLARENARKSTIEG